MNEDNFNISALWPEQKPRPKNIFSRHRRELENEHTICICGKCGSSKPNSDFAYHKPSETWTHECKKCTSARKSAHQKMVRERIKAEKLKQ